ncbi:MFS transporter [Trichodelitschia bisporula]|uniref:MFS transporter n=1 Tax=Trichodelitschia bisporula TaxID=703511 RepID=A0A6G1HJ46_9PEZI|nr:MFS transporter [Trichodelitschia bisporula]
MLLTPQQSSSRDPSSFPTVQLLILALVRVSEPIALTSIFPYAWKLVLHYEIGNESDAAFYAGVLIAAFSFAEALTGIFWGTLSDRIGRKKVLIFGTTGTMLSLLVLGFAGNFWVALFGRVFGGMLNGNIGVIQTMVGELVSNPKHEPRAFAVMPFVWSIGTIIGPAIGGYFANPTKTFPTHFSADGLFGKFPYLLPNLICSAMLLGSIIAAYFFLFETHPDMQPWSTQADLENTTAATPLIPASGAMANAPADLSTESYGTFDSVVIEDRRANDRAGRSVDRSKLARSSSATSTMSTLSATAGKVYTRNVLVLIAALGIYTYHSMTYDHLMPIFFQDEKDYGAGMTGGLGLSTQQVGIIMSVNGIIALFVQGLIFPFMASWLGVWPLFVIVTIGHPLAYVIMPFLSALPPNWLYTGIYTCLFVRNFFSIIAYPLLLILIKEAAPSSSHLGKINGLAASTGGACRTVASPVAGYLYGLGSQMHFSALAWWASAIIAVFGAFQIPWIKRQKHKTAHVRTAAAWAESIEEQPEGQKPVEAEPRNM